MAVVLGRQAPATLSPRDAVEARAVLAFERVPDVDHRDEMLVRIPRIGRLFIAMAWTGEAVSQAAAKHLGVLI
jgi:hypothetical protein